MQSVTANPSTAQTNTELVAAITDKAVRIQEIFISSDTALTVTLEDDADSGATKFRQYVGASGGAHVKLRNPITLADGGALDYSTSDNGNVFLLVFYEQV